MKILIGCPTCDRYKYCIGRWLKAVEEIISFSKDIQIDYLLVDNSKEEVFFNKLKEKNINIIKVSYVEDVKQRIANSRNLLRDKVINEGYDYFFSLEQDIIPEKEALSRLLASKKEIISAYYGKPACFRVQDRETNEIKNIQLEIPVAFLQLEDGIRRALPQEILEKGVIQVGAFGVGCLLIHREALNKIKFRIEENKKAFDDMLFCKDAKSQGYKLFLDSDIRPAHLHKPWD